MAPDERDVLTRALLEQNRRWLEAYFLAATGDRARAEDLTQDVFSRALAGLKTYDPARPLGAWLRGIARNLLLTDRQKTRRLHVCVDPAALDRLDRAAARLEEESVDTESVERRRRTLADCVSKLTERAREALRQKYHDRAPSRRIGERLRMTGAAVNMLLMRARRSLAECLGGRA